VIETVSALRLFTAAALLWNGLGLSQVPASEPAPVASSRRAEQWTTFDSKLALAVNVPRGDGTYSVGYTPTPDGRGVPVNPATRWRVRPAKRQRSGYSSAYEEHLFDPAQMEALADDLVRGCVPGLSLFKCDRVRDADLAPLAKARHLRLLDLGHGFDGPVLTDAALSVVGQLPELEDLDLSGQSGIKGRSFPGLSGCQKLRRLDLSPTGVDDDAIATFPELAELRALRVGSDALRGESMIMLRSCPRLVFLGLSGRRLVDEALRQIGRLPHLIALELDQFPEITDTGLLALAGSKTLRVIWVRNRWRPEEVRITPAGVAELRRKLPGAVVVYTKDDEAKYRHTAADPDLWWSGALP
jgi:hypothetical protein